MRCALQRPPNHLQVEFFQSQCLTFQVVGIFEEQVISPQYLCHQRSYRRAFEIFRSAQDYRGLQSKCLPRQVIISKESSMEF